MLTPTFSLSQLSLGAHCHFVSGIILALLCRMQFLNKNGVITPILLFWQ
jgi:hypothetical protein